MSQHKLRCGRATHADQGIDNLELLPEPADDANDGVRRRQAASHRCCVTRGQGSMELNRRAVAKAVNDHQAVHVVSRQARAAFERG